MNSTIINNYNSTVKPGDFVIHLGDLFCGTYNPRDAKNILSKLNGRKILLRGNHDNFNDHFYEEYFETVGLYLIIGEYFLCHYPLSVNKYTKEQEHHLIKIFKDSGCSKIIHGHTHNNPTNYKDNIPRINASLEVQNYTPILMNF